MNYVEISVEEAIRKCEKNKELLVAEQNLTDENYDLIFVKKRRSDYDDIFNDVKSVIYYNDDFVTQLKCLTEDVQKIVLLKE